MYPTSAVTFGQTSADVKLLQQFLISQGYAIPAGATGYFGEQTKTALAGWQSAHGIDASVPGYGTDWGPKSIAAAAGTTPVSASGTVIGTYQGQPVYAGTDAQINAQVQKIQTGGTTPSAGVSNEPQVGQTVVNNSNPNAIETYTYQGGGKWSVSDTAHGAWPTTVSTAQVQAAAGVPFGLGTPTTSITSPELSTILSDPNLTAGQKTAIQSVYSAVQSNDTDVAARIKAAMEAAGTYSGPYFKAQIRIATDALTRGLSSQEGDLAFKEGQLRSALDELRANTAASKEQLSFQHAQELQQLQQKYETDLATTQDNLAMAGLTSSSKRARAEQILADTNTGLVESSNKQFGYQTGNLDRTLAATEATTAAEIANAQRISAEGGLDLYRTTEANVGSTNLPSVSGMTPLGEIGGSIPQAQVKDQLSFASNFV